MNFDWKEAISQRPSGLYTSQLISYYGNPAGPGSVDQDGNWFKASPQWARENLVELQMSQVPNWPPYPNGKRPNTITIHRKVAPVMIATVAEANRRGLMRKLRTYNGCFAPRRIGHKAGGALSVHAFAAAVDFDAEWNAYGVPFEKMQIDRDFLRCMEECGWTAGARWTGQYADGMHFQWTDPLPNTNVQPWQDAMAKESSPQVSNYRLMVDSGSGFKEANGKILELTGMKKIVINGTDKDTVWIRAEYQPSTKP